MVSEAQKKAKAKYEKANVSRVTLDFYPGQHAVYDWVDRKAVEKNTSRVKVVREIIERAYESSK